MQTISEEPEVNFINLMAGFGGTCGLFIGLSFVTVFEIGTFLVDLVMHGFLWSRVAGQSGENEKLSSYGEWN